MASNYVFIFGRDYELSFLELKIYLKNNYNINLKLEDKELVIVNIKNFNSRKAIDDLGGIVKIGEEIKSFDELYFGKKNKIKYGLSVYSGEDIKKELKDYFKEIKLKATLKKSHRGNILMPSEVIKYDLIKEGVEVLKFDDLLFKTIEVFDPRPYKERDKKPYFDEKRVISIRLARIMINLSQLKKGELLLDPFCGTGTILQEAMLKNIKVLGIDKDGETIIGARQNLEWIKKKYNLKGDYKLLRGDSRDLSKLIRKVDGVVTEPYLGPFLKKLPTLEEARKILNKLERLYNLVLKEIKRILNKKGRIIIIIPRFRTWNNKIVKMNFSRIIEGNGFKLDILDDKVSNPVIYETNNGKIQREIYFLKQ